MLHEICVIGTVLWSPTNDNSSTYTYISHVSGNHVSDFRVSVEPPALYSHRDFFKKIAHGNVKIAHKKQHNLQPSQNFQNWQPAQNQPQFFILLHKNGSPQDLYIMTFEARWELIQFHTGLTLAN